MSLEQSAASPLPTYPKANVTQLKACHRAIVAVVKAFKQHEELDELLAGEFLASLEDLFFAVNARIDARVVKVAPTLASLTKSPRS